eukprot:3567487-Heterocapsa_arctica.AAC.1
MRWPSLAKVCTPHPLYWLLCRWPWFSIRQQSSLFDEPAEESTGSGPLYLKVSTRFGSLRSTAPQAILDKMFDQGTALFLDKGRRTNGSESSVMQLQEFPTH